MSRLGEIAPWIAYAALLGGIIFLVVGVLVRGAAPVEWGFLFGFAKNSTPAGKAIYVLGALLLVGSVNVLVVKGLRRRREAGCPHSTRVAKVVRWEDSGLLRIKLGSKEVLCVFSPTWNDADALEDARKAFPAESRLCAASSGKAAARYQVHEGERVKTCTLYRSRRKLLSDAWRDAQKAAAEADGDDGDDAADDDIE